MVGCVLRGRRWAMCDGGFAILPGYCWLITLAILPLLFFFFFLFLFFFSFLFYNFFFFCLLHVCLCVCVCPPVPHDKTTSFRESLTVPALLMHGVSSYFLILALYHQKAYRSSAQNPQMKNLESPLIRRDEITDKERDLGRGNGEVRVLTTSAAAVRLFPLLLLYSVNVGLKFSMDSHPVFVYTSYFFFFFNS